MDTKTCNCCGISKPIAKFGVKKSANGCGYILNMCNTCSVRRYKDRLRIEFLDAFGWKCSCCGEADPRFLTLDHINNDGYLHRKSKNGKKRSFAATLAEAAREGWPKDKYDCLCFNCNAGRQWNGGTCPHKSISVEEHKKKMYSSLDNTSNSEDAKIRNVANLLNLSPEAIRKAMDNFKGKEIN